MPEQAEALEAKRKYVQSLTRSARLLGLSTDEHDFLDQGNEHKQEPALDRHIPVRLNFHIVLPATTDSTVYDQIFESIKRHFPPSSYNNTRRKQQFRSSYY
jgi:hypothetical protein